MAFLIPWNGEEMATERLMQKFNRERFQCEDMQRDIACITQWFKENTKDMTTDEIRLFCLNFVMNSGMLYMVLLSCCHLPILDIDDIKELDMNFDTGVSKDLMKYLEGQLGYWEPKTKYISLILAEMPIKMNIQHEEATDKIIGFQDVDGEKSSDFASRTLLIAAQGCIEMFFQPLGYAFLSEKDLSDKLITWIKKTIKQLEDSGFSVCSVVSQQTPMFQKLTDRLGVTSQKPYFEVYGKKVFYMFDPVHLLVAIRDVLLNTNLFYDDDMLVSWSDIVDVHKHCKLLTEAHINPAPAPKIRTEKEREKHRKLAVEVFNPLISVLIRAKYRPEESGTASFMFTMFNVFKILMDDFGTTLPSYTGSEQQVEAFNKAISMTQRVRLPESETQTEIPCFSGLQITLNAVMQLQEYCKQQEMNTVFMSMVNTEQMHKHQEVMRKICKSNSLTPVQFKYAFSKVMLNDFIRNPINDSVSSCIGPMFCEMMPSSSEFEGKDVGEKEHNRLLDSIRSGTFEVIFKSHVLPSTNGSQKRRRVPK